jgi:hypothetical protein
MGQSNNEISGFLAELASEATKKLEAERAVQEDRETITQNVNGALVRTFQFFNLFTKHLNALESDVPRTYALDGKTQFSQLKWKSGMVDFRKQSFADNALMDYVYFQVKLAAPESVVVIRRWEQYDEIKKDLDAYGLKTADDMHELWRNRSQKATFQVNLDPEFIIWMRFKGNYAGGSINLESNNLDGFGAANGKLKPELLQSNILDGIGRFLLGRSSSLPQELALVRDFSRNR